MDELLREYLPILVFLGVAAGLGLALVLAAVVIAVRNPYAEKISAYECGFNAFDDARMKFDVRFYLVAILFIIFDLEVAFLFPWAASFKDQGLLGFWSMMVFLAVLTVGFAYEWKKVRSNGSDGPGASGSSCGRCGGRTGDRRRSESPGSRVSERSPGSGIPCHLERRRH